MKKILAFTATLVSTMAAGSVLASDRSAGYEVVCNSMHIADAGYAILIERDGRTGRLTAVVSEHSFVGTREIGRVRVERVIGRSAIEYRALDFKLGIRTMSRLPGGGYRGRVVGEAILHPEFAKDLRCDFSGDELPTNRSVEFRGGATCMAYWSGFRFDSAGGKCVADGASGCSSPFEFETAKDCEEAYAFPR